MKKTVTRFKEDLLKNCGALVSLQELANYTKKSRKWLSKRLQGLEPVDNATRKRVWYYEDVAEYLFNCGQHAA